MSLESTTTIAGLVSANPTAGDPFSQGDDHLRLIKTVLKTTFPGVAAAGYAIPITATEAELNYVHGVTSAIQTQFASMAGSLALRVPLGIICMWHGSVASIPAGWFLCDGNNGTPDLTGKFVLCYDSVNYPTIFTTGGYADAAIIAHTHTATSTPNISGLSTGNNTTLHTHAFTTGLESDNHTHAYTAGGYVGSGNNLGSGTSYNAGGIASNTGTESSAHTHSGTTVTDSAFHDHDVIGSMTVATAVATATGGVSGTGRNLPPFMVLAYIMKG